MPLCCTENEGEPNNGDRSRKPCRSISVLRSSIAFLHFFHDLISGICTILPSALNL
jgi:hypothetical protein